MRNDATSSNTANSAVRRFPPNSKMRAVFVISISSDIVRPVGGSFHSVARLAFLEITEVSERSRLAVSKMVNPLEKSLSHIDNLDAGT
jgi:hypothetical protein